MTLRCQKLLAQVSLSISPDTRVGDLGLGQQQLVEIAKALNKQVRLLILDEPTASLTEQETSVLLDIIRDLQQHGIACIYISHKLNEVKAISDTICVIRDGQHIGTRDAAGMSEDDIITMMVGRELTALYPNEPHTTGDEILRIEHLTAWHPVNRHIKRVNDVISRFTDYTHVMCVGGGAEIVAEAVKNLTKVPDERFYLSSSPQFDLVMGMIRMKGGVTNE